MRSARFYVTRLTSCSTLAFNSRSSSPPCRGPMRAPDIVEQNLRSSGSRLARVPSLDRIEPSTLSRLLARGVRTTQTLAMIRTALMMLRRFAVHSGALAGRAKRSASVMSHRPARAEFRPSRCAVLPHYAGRDGMRTPCSGRKPTDPVMTSTDGASPPLLPPATIAACNVHRSPRRTLDPILSSPGDLSSAGEGSNADLSRTRVRQRSAAPDVLVGHGPARGSSIAVA